MASASPMLHLAAPTADALNSLSCEKRSPCRSQTRASDCARGGTSQRGRMQRCAQGQFREASRASSARFGSRGSSAGPRSRSGTRCRRPSAEVELRTSDATMQDAVDTIFVNDCANGFVCDLIDDAVDDFADDLVHDVDDVCLMAATKNEAEVLAVSDARLVLNAGEPAISEEVDEDEEICAAASVITEEAAEEAIRVAIPPSPSFSTNVNVPTPATKPLTSVKQLELTLSDSEEGTEETNDDGYEEVYSLASEDPYEAEELDEEIEALAYVKMAVNLAKTAVSRGCAEITAEEAAENNAKEDFAEFDLEQAKAAARDALRNALLGGQGKESEEDESDMESESEDVELDLEKAKESARTALRHALLDGEAPMVDLNEAKAAARKALVGALLGPNAAAEEAEQLEQEELLGVGEEPAQGDEMAFDMASVILDGAFQQAATTWNAPEKAGENKEENEVDEDEEDEEEDEESDEEDEETRELRMETKRTLLQAALSGELRKVLEEQKQAKKMEELRLQVRQTMMAAASNGKLEQYMLARAEAKVKVDEVQNLRERVRQTFLSASANGKFEQFMAERAEAKKKAPEAEELKTMVRQTFIAAASNGRLDQVLAERREAKKVEDLRAQVRQTFLSSASNGRLKEVLAERAQAKQLEDLRAQVGQTFLSSASNGRLKEVLAERAQAKQLDDLKAQVRQTVLTAASNGRLNEVLAERAEAKKLEELRTQVRKTLFDAAMNGTFSKFMAEREQAKKAQNAKLTDLEASMAEQSQEKLEEKSQVDKIEQLRLSIKETMLKATQTGDLNKYFAERAARKKAAELRELKIKARQLLLKAAEEREMEKARSLEAVKLKARETLLKAAGQLQLQRESNPTEDQDNKTHAQKLMSKARDALTKAAVNGELAPALRTVFNVEEESPEAALKRQVKETLLTAAVEGRLLPALQMVAPQTQEADKAGHESQENLEKWKARARVSLENYFLPKESGMDEVKRKAQSALEKQFLPQADQDSIDIQDLKQQARNSLLQAAKAGSLAGILQKCSDPAKPKAAAIAEDEMKLKVRQVLSKGLRTGELSTSLQTALSNDRAEALRNKLKNTFEKAVSSKTLASTVDDVLANRVQASPPSRPQLGRQFCPVPAPPVAEEPFPADCLPPQPALVSPPPPAEINWPTLRAAAAAELPSKPSTRREGSRPMRRSTSKTTIEAPTNAVADDLEKPSALRKLALDMGCSMASVEATDDAGNTTARKEALMKLINKAKTRPQPLSTPISNAMPTNDVAASPIPSSRTMTPSRSRRRIIGGVVRTPSIILQEPIASPAAVSSQKKRTKDRKEPKEVLDTFAMDMSGGEESTSNCVRDSSLARGYDTLGAQFYSLHDDDDHTPIGAKQESPSMSSALAFNGQLMLQQPRVKVSDLDRSFSKSGSRQRAAPSSGASMSAMAMDLGLGEGSSCSTSARNALPLSAFKFDLKPLSVESKMRTSQSLGALRSTKQKPANGLLPTLATEKKSAESIAWTMQMSKTTSKWCGATGLRGSASMGVF